MLFRALKIDYVWKGEKVSFDTAIEDEEPQVLDD
jgi:hypothetical protein